MRGLLKTILLLVLGKGLRIMIMRRGLFRGILLKIDPAEGNVILGIQNLIKRSRPVIFIECSKNGRENVWKVLKDLNYHCFNSKDIEILDINDYRSDDFLWIPVISN